MNKRTGFTLIELLVVIAIIALLLSIIMPSLKKAKLQSAAVVCMSLMKEIGVSAEIYNTSFNGWIPVGVWGQDRENTNGFSNRWNWRQRLNMALGEDPYSSKGYDCPAAKKLNFINDHFDCEENLASPNTGSIGPMFQGAYKYANEFGHTWNDGCEYWPTAPNRAWRDPVRSMYVADSYGTFDTQGDRMYPSIPLEDFGTNHMHRPDMVFDGASRRFSDRHLGTNLLFLDGRAERWDTEELDEMEPGGGPTGRNTPDIPWDTL